MGEFRYSLEGYKGMGSRYFCPRCKRRCLTRYKDNYSGKYLADNVGRCNREEKCAYHFTPSMHFEIVGYETDHVFTVDIKEKPKPNKASCIDKDILNESLKDYHQNNFATGLYQYFSCQEVDAVMEKYKVGTAKGNKTVFWQVNRVGKVRTGKVIKYDAQTLKRYPATNWVHSVLKIKEFNLKQVYFGSHLLYDTKTPVAIAEGEKNAILGALYYPQFNWIAVGGVRMLNIDKPDALKDFDVTLFPDKGEVFKLWSGIAQRASFEVSVNSIIEKTELPDGSDIADLVISIKKAQHSESPQGILESFISINPLVNLLIEKFDLSIES